MTRNPNKYLLLQYTAAIATSMSALGFSCGYSWPSPSLPYLTGENSEIQITREQGSWIASLYPLGLIIGYLLNPFFIDRIGRKWTILIFTVPQIASWLLIIIAKNYLNFYIARLIGGIGYGGGVSSATVYISEIGNLKNRGIFLVLMRCMINLGFLFTMILGAFLSYKNMNLVFLMMPISFFIFFIFMPDSSYFLNKNQNEELGMIKLHSLKDKEEMKKFIVKEDEFKNKEHFEFRNVNKRNCGTNNFIDNNGGVSNSELSKLETNCGIKNFEVKNYESKFSKSIKNEKIDQQKNSVIRKFNIKKTTPWKLFAFPNNRRALLIVLVMGLTNIFSGHAGLTAFTEQIFTYEGSFLAPKTATVVLATMTMIFSIISTQIVERIKRKVLLLFTGIIAAISTTLVGIFFFCKDQNINVEYFEWLPLFGLTTYDMMLSCGLANIFFIYQGELYANEIKSVAISFSKINYMVLSFIYLLEFHYFTDTMETYMTFWFFTVGILFGTFFVYILTPETKGESLSEIQILLKSGKLFYK